MPIIPPDPGKVLDALRAQLEQLRELVAAYPGERAYTVAAEHVAAAIGALEVVVPKSAGA
jgi:hypothetical protein